MCKLGTPQNDWKLSDAIPSSEDELSSLHCHGGTVGSLLFETVFNPLPSIRPCATGNIKHHNEAHDP